MARAATPSRRSGPATIAAPTGRALLDAALGGSGIRSVAGLRRVAPRLGIHTVRDLLFHLPRRYDDLRELRRIGDLRTMADGEIVSARATVAEIRVEPTFRRRIQRTIARLTDDTGEAEAVWFGRRYIERRVHAGDRLIVSGKLRRRGFTPLIDNPEFQLDDGAALLHAGRIVPVYRLTSGLTAVRLRGAIRDALDAAGPSYDEYLPAAIRNEEGLVGVGRAIESAHFPERPEDKDEALRRLAFDELFALQLGMVERRLQRGRSRGTVVAVDDARDAEIRSEIAKALGRRIGRAIELTPDQETAMIAVRGDLASPEPMLRLIQGDVGSGKTAVAAHALALAATAGKQGALLAPTDLLARQHLSTVGELLAPLGIPVTLLTGSLPADAKRASLQAIETGQAAVVIGTHALLQERVTFGSLGLVVIDEQHRFGVDQRSQLEAKAAGTAPHVLLMTATPIPRTLGQVLYADLDVSDLRTPPAGRVPIRTGIRGTGQLGGTWQRVRDEAAAGHRAFVVVPLIVEGEDDEDAEVTATSVDVDSSAVAATTEAERLRGLLAPLRVGLVHGRMRAVDRDAEMARFRDGELDVLVGTTVVEVGVDVPEATMMIVEGADRFGLAQLHQLRGRVGRGSAESFCVLVSDSSDPVPRARLEAVAATRDGFELAEADFALRREGNVLGFAQSGLPRLRVASLQNEDHRQLATDARRHAEALLGGDRVELEAPELAALTRELQSGWLARIAAGENPEAAGAA